MFRSPVCSLIFALTVGLASSYVLDDIYSGKDEFEENETKEVENEKRDDFPDLNGSWSSDELDDVMVEDLPQSIIDKAKNLANGKCSKVYVQPRNRVEEEKGAQKKFYQSFQHGEKSIMSDEKWMKAKKSEKCTTCVLNELCRGMSAETLQQLNIESTLPATERERKCKMAILSQKLDVSSPEQSQKINCNPRTPFRTIDGTCNNLQNPTFGAVNTQFNRLIAADYGDSISTPRLATCGKELPNARDVSRFVHGSNKDRTNPNSTLLTHLTMNFGQFMDHDTTLAKAQGLNCEPPTTNPECINIEIPEDDATFRDRKVDIIEMERDALHEPPSFCKLVTREHINTITAYVDASNVYGSTEEVANSVRVHPKDSALLKVMKHPDGKPFRNLLPPQTEESGCPSLDPQRPCFLAGDERNNENPGLNSVHTIFVRQHNRIATFLSNNNNNNNWRPKRIFEETRKIIGAQLQVITYNEFLPLILSKKTIKKFGLELLKGTQFFNGYDKNVNAQMTNAFSVAAYRFGHSLVQEWFRRFSQIGFEHKRSECGLKTEFRPIPVLDFNNPQYLYETDQGGVDAIVRGLVKDSAAKSDGRFSSSVQENLRRGEGDLSDLVSINIQRGRERGLPGYTKYRNLQLCGLSNVKSFDDLKNVAGFAEEDVENLRKVYDNVHDIDLFVGGMLEPKPSDGGVLGPTFQCIVAEQFKRLRVGDRFWHENAPNQNLNTDRTAYNGAMLQEIRKTTFAKILCDNADSITAVNKMVFQQSKERVNCDQLPTVSLTPWITPHRDLGEPDDVDDDLLDDDDPEF